MLVMLILFIVLGLSTISAVVFRKEFRNLEHEILCIATWFALIVSAIIFIFSEVYIIVEQSSYSRNSIQIEYNERYKVITTAMDKGEDLTLLTSDIFNYNKEILKARNELNNPWTNWFTNNVYNEIPLIELEDKEN